MTLGMLTVLIGLGVWQVHRLAWKTELLAAIDRAEAGPAIPLTDVPSPFAKVRVQGRFRPDLAAVYGVSVRDTPIGPVMGADLLQPLEREDGSLVLVDRGWVPQSSDKEVAMPSGPVSVEAFVRPAEAPHWFSPSDDVPGRHFYTLNPSAIAAALGLRSVAPFTLVALGQPSPSGYPIARTSLPRPPNNHLSYAITWFGLAGALLVVFVAWTRKALRP